MIVPSDFPEGDAGAVRDVSIAKMYMALGYDVILIGMGRKESYGVYENICFRSLYEKKSTIFDKIKNYVMYKHRLYNEVHEVVRSYGAPSIIHINHVANNAMKSIIKKSEEHGIIVIHDSTEWYSKSEFTLGAFDKAYILKDRLNRYIIRKPVRVIAISTYLEKYFASKGLIVKRIPVIMDVLNSEYNEQNDDDLINFIYAGNPGKKDYVKEMVEGLELLTEEKKRKIIVHILGITTEDLLELTGFEQLPRCIKTYGRVSRDRVKEVMRSMDFSILMRPKEERYSKAGFPTKTVEAMSHRVAMICNITSDLDMYLIDGVNSIIVEACSSQAFSESIERVLKLSRVEIEIIKDNARQQAEREFDYRNWVSSLSNLINDTSVPN